MGANDPYGKAGPQPRFDPQKFTIQLNEMGLTYRWSRAVECPCRLNSKTSQWDPTCPRCGGDGWMYVNPCAQEDRHVDRDYSEVRAIFSNVTSHPSITEEFGGFEFGEAQLTVQNSHRVAFRDRFIGVEQEYAWSELAVRGEGNLIPVGKCGRTREEQETALRYEPVRVNYLMHTDGTVYYLNVDFKLTEGFGSQPRRLEWLPGKGPLPGEVYTIHYDFHPVWIVDSAVYKVQNSRGPAAGLSGRNILQVLPTTFKVKVDFLTPARGE